MRKLLRQLADRWGSWVGDRDMELQIRRALTRDGYMGASAELSRVRLVFIQRPGWIQVYSFDARLATQQRESRSVYGLLRQDERSSRCEIQCLTSPAARASLLQEWSAVE